MKEALNNIKINIEKEISRSFSNSPKVNINSQVAEQANENAIKTPLASLAVGGVIAVGGLAYFDSTLGRLASVVVGVAPFVHYFINKNKSIESSKGSDIDYFSYKSDLKRFIQNNNRQFKDSWEDSISKLKDDLIAKVKSANLDEDTMYSRLEYLYIYEYLKLDSNDFITQINNIPESDSTFELDCNAIVERYKIYVLAALDDVVKRQSDKYSNLSI